MQSPHWVGNHPGYKYHYCHCDECWKEVMKILLNSKSYTKTYVNNYFNIN